jgi:hypothetical protein
MYLDLILEVPLKAQKAHSLGMGFLYFQVGDQRNSERRRRELSPARPNERVLDHIANTRKQSKSQQNQI